MNQELTLLHLHVAQPSQGNSLKRCLVALRTYIQPYLFRDMQQAAPCKGATELPGHHPEQGLVPVIADFLRLSALFVCDVHILYRLVLQSALFSVQTFHDSE